MPRHSSLVGIARKGSQTSCIRSGGAALVSVVKPADLGERVVISDVVGKDSSEMVFTEDDDVVQTLSP